MILKADRCTLRPWRTDDVPALPGIANDFEVARYMARRFPHPYTIADAQSWIERTAAQETLTIFAIEVDGELAGGIGCEPNSGERAGDAETGYYLGRRFWGRGIATSALRALVSYAFSELGLRRLQASVMAPNVASMRVLEHNGFLLEGIMRKFYVDRDDLVQDGHLYARVAP